jgi:hypothetical protein
MPLNGLGFNALPVQKKPKALRFGQRLNQPSQIHHASDTVTLRFGNHAEEPITRRHGRWLKCLTKIGMEPAHWMKTKYKNILI